MVSLLLDTVTFLYIVQNNPKLAGNASSAFLSLENTRYLSHISVIELAIKYRNGKLPLSAPPHEIAAIECEARDIALLPLDLPSIALMETLPLHHKDPFDRLLVCQARTHGLTLVSPDRIFHKYKVKTVW